MDTASTPDHGGRRALVVGPHEQYLRRPGYISAAVQLPGPLSDLAQEDGAILMEPNRRALAEWERTLRLHMAEYQRLGRKQRRFFVPANRFEIAMRKVVKYGMDFPVTSPLLRRLQDNSKDGRLKEWDIARV